MISARRMHGNKRIFWGWSALLMILLLAAVWPHAAAATERTVRCQGSLVGIGADKAEVLEKCGQPEKIDRWEEGPNRYFSQPFDYEQDRYLAPKSFRGPIRFERWTYNFGSNRLLYYLVFENGKLITIDSGDRGSD